MKQILLHFQSIVFFLILSVLLIVSIAGSIPDIHTPSAIIGSYKLAPFDNGLSLFESDRGYYYTVSPFNDYIILEDGFRSSLISLDEIRDKSFVSSFNQSSFENTVNTVKSFWGDEFPSLIFEAKHRIVYTSEITGNKVTIKRSLQTPKEEKISSIGFAIGYIGKDYIFDSYGNLYTYHPANEIALLSNALGRPFQIASEDLRITVPDKTLYILNPNTAGVLKITAQQNQILYVNRDKKLIEIEENTNTLINPYETSLSIEILENYKKV